MQKVIIIKYGELTTKKDNISFFLNTLKNNILKTLSNYDINLKMDMGRMFIYASDEALPKIIEDLQYVFGIHEIILGYIDNDLEIDAIKNNALDLISKKEFATFKIETKRSNKHYSLTSMEISRMVGSHILKNMTNINVDVHNPDVLFEIEVRQNEILYFDTKYSTLGGYPVGTLGKGLLMLSGGIDSPVAGYLAIKRGVKLEAIYFESPPHTSMQAKNKVLELASILAKYNAKMKVHVINFTKIQEEILKKLPNEYLITIMRRMMYRIGERIAYRNKCLILVNGESIGQVASQTLTSMKAINEVVNLPVIRPVACFDKLEIIAIAKKINTYETSILPFEDCCTIFVPTHPVINPSSEKCKEYEEMLDYDTLINEAVRSKEIIIVGEENNKKFEDIL